GGSTKRMRRHARGLRGDPVVQPERQREKKRRHRTPGEGRFKKACENCRERSAWHRDEQPRKSKPKHAPRRCAWNFFNAKPERLKKFGAHRRSRAMSILAIPRL